MTEDFSAVRLELESRSEAPGLVRAALAGVAEQLDLDSELFDDLKTAVSEACNNVVLYAYDGKPGPLAVELEIGPQGIAASIRDWGGGIQQVGPSDERMGVGLAVISALADRAEFITDPQGGTEVRMAFTGGRQSIRPVETGSEADPVGDPPVRLTGDVVVTLWPAAPLLSGVLGRVTRAVAARTHLSLDRFSDLYLVSDAIAAFLQSAAGTSPIVFAVAGGDRRLELTVGPFPPGEGARLIESGLSDGHGSPIALRVAELAVELAEDSEVLRVVIDDRRR